MEIQGDNLKYSLLEYAIDPLTNEVRETDVPIDKNFRGTNEATTQDFVNSMMETGVRDPAVPQEIWDLLLDSEHSHSPTRTTSCTTCHHHATPFTPLTQCSTCLTFDLETDTNSITDSFPTTRTTTRSRSATSFPTEKYDTDSNDSQSVIPLYSTYTSTTNVLSHHNQTPKFIGFAEQNAFKKLIHTDPSLKDYMHQTHHTLKTKILPSSHTFLRQQMGLEQTRRNEVLGVFDSRHRTKEQIEKEVKKIRLSGSTEKMLESIRQRQEAELYM